jgi:hypothetical protein
VGQGGVRQEGVAEEGQGLGPGQGHLEDVGPGHEGHEAQDDELQGPEPKPFQVEDEEDVQRREPGGEDQGQAEEEV